MLELLETSPIPALEMLARDGRLAELVKLPLPGQVMPLGSWKELELGGEDDEGELLEEELSAAGWHWQRP
jgi:hypothetical protein